MALSPGYSPRPVLCAALCLAAAGFSVGATCAISMGFPAAVRNLWSRENCVQHFVFPHYAPVPLDGPRRWHGDRTSPGLYINTDSASFSQHSGSVEWITCGRLVSVPDRAAAAITRSDLIARAAIIGGGTSGKSRRKTVSPILAVHVCGG